MLGSCSGSSAEHETAAASKTGSVITLRYRGRTQRVDLARSVLHNRFTALGFPDNAVDVDRERHLLYVRLPNRRAPSEALAKLAVQTAQITFQPVRGVFRYGPMRSAKNKNAASSCRRFETPHGQDVADSRQVILPDRPDEHGAHEACYALGRTLLDGSHIGSAQALRDQGQEVVNVHFDDDSFIRKVAQPLLNKEVAIVLDGVVLSAPTINPGITGRDVEISGSFTKDEAAALALELRYGALPVQLHFVSIAPAA